ncbi:MAG: MerR family transcriptional regulator [Pseudomonadota bacterium]
MAKSPDAFRTISEVATELDVAQHVLRFWETKFDEIAPVKRGGNRRYYRPDDVALLKRINTLLYTDGYTIKGVQKLLADRGVKAVLAGPDAAAVAEPSDKPATDHMAVLPALRQVRDRLSSAIDAAHQR